MINTIELSKAIEQGFTQNEYSSKSLNSEIESLQGFGKVVPMVTTSVYDGKTHFEHIIIYIEVEGILLKPYKNYNENNYKFYLAESLEVRDFNHELIAPKKVGKPTKKKLLDWVEYLQKVEVLKVEVLAQRKKKETEFFDKIKNSGLPISHQSKDGKSGYIIKDNFEYHFEVLANGYINQKIRFTCSQNIDNFIKF